MTINIKYSLYIKLAIGCAFLSACGSDTDTGTGTSPAVDLPVYVPSGTLFELYVQASDPRHGFLLDTIDFGTVRLFETFLVNDEYCLGETIDGTHNERYETTFCIENTAGIDRLGQPSCYTGGVISFDELRFNEETYVHSADPHADDVGSECE